MSQTVNKYNLSRYIPSEIRRIVRRRCGFGCIFCGAAVTAFHHFDPPFEDAKLHDPSSLTLLCGTHHDLVGRTRISNRAVRTKNADPIALQTGFTRDDLLFESSDPIVRFGDSKFRCQYPIVVENEALIGFERAGSLGEPLELSASFSDNNGIPLVQIVRNELRMRSDNWDIITRKDRFEIRNDKDKVVFAMTFRSDEGLVIQHLDMAMKGGRITVDKSGLTIITKGITNSFSDCDIGGVCGYVRTRANASYTITNWRPLFNYQIEEFSPKSPLEHSLMHYYEGESENRLFATTLNSTGFFVISDQRSPEAVALKSVRLDQQGQIAILCFTSKDRIAEFLKKHEIGSILAYEVGRQALVQMSEQYSACHFNYGSSISTTINLVSLLNYTAE